MDWIDYFVIALAVAFIFWFVRREVSWHDFRTQQWNIDTDGLRVGQKLFHAGHEPDGRWYVIVRIKPGRGQEGVVWVRPE